VADAKERRDIRLGPDLAAGERPQAVVPAGAWQQAASLGDWTLVGCTVAPGFQFAGFELAPPGFEPGFRREVRSCILPTLPAPKLCCPREVAGRCGSNSCLFRAL
jgi:hypothetical protein